MAALGQAVDFENQIKPLLSDRCFTCHGPDENTRKADLHLYSREGAMDIITPGKPETSELFKRLVTTDPDDLMPPPDSNLSLSAEEKDSFLEDEFRQRTVPQCGQDHVEFNVKIASQRPLSGRTEL